jgi:porin
MLSAWRNDGRPQVLAARIVCATVCWTAAAALLAAPGVRPDLAAARAAPTSAPASAPTRSARGTTFKDKASGDWFGARQRLEDAGISIAFDALLEGFKNFRGGLNTSEVVGAPTLDLSLTLDTERLLNWHGGTFHVDLEYHGGQNPTEVLVGDLQVFDKSNASRYFQFFELWYEQKLLDDKIRLKIGKVDANTEFSVIDSGLAFLNSSSQVSPTNFLMPTTPDPMPGLNVFVTPVRCWYVSFGAYYANRSDRFGDLVGHPNLVQVSDFGAYLIEETGLSWQNAPLLHTGGNLKLGAWEHTGTFTRFDGSQQHGTYGYYAILNQTLWQPPGAGRDGRGVRSFLEWGRTQDTINAIDQHAGGGVTWTGPTSRRPLDIAGFTSQYAHISPHAGLPDSYELALETFYRAQITPWATLQPDLQFIVNPGGQYRDAVVLTLRLVVHL